MYLLAINCERRVFTRQDKILAIKRNKMTGSLWDWIKRQRSITIYIRSPHYKRRRASDSRQTLQLFDLIQFGILLCVQHIYFLVQWSDRFSPIHSLLFYGRLFIQRNACLSFINYSINWSEKKKERWWSVRRLRLDSSAYRRIDRLLMLVLYLSRCLSISHFFCVALTWTTAIVHTIFVLERYALHCRLCGTSIEFKVASSTAKKLYILYFIFLSPSLLAR